MKLEREIHQPEFSKEREKLIVNVLYSGNWMNQRISEILRKYGLTVQQYNILRILKGQFPNPSTVNLLIERMLDKMSNASRIIDRLEKKSYVTRTVCKKDRRLVDVLITGKGIAILDKIAVTEGNLGNKLITISKKEISVLNTLLDRLRG